MDKKYLAKIIATDNEGLQMISACCAGAEVKVKTSNILKRIKIFLLSLKEIKLKQKMIKKVNSICKFDFVDKLNLKI